MTVETASRKATEYIPIEGGNAYVMESAENIGFGFSTLSTSTCVWMNKESAEQLARDLCARLNLFVTGEKS